MMAAMQPLLIELGTEELPVSALPGLAQALFDGVAAGLEKRGIALDRGDAKPLYTPRRLAVLLPGVADEQPEQASEVLGPYLNIALDADGQPTKALQGFAAKAGVAWTQLEKNRDARGERFVHRAVTPGAKTLELLAEVVREAVAAMPIPKQMRWGAHEYAFARPVHWLVMLLGGEIAPGEILGAASGRESRGHRFAHPQALPIDHPAHYVERLRAAQVLVDADERREAIVRQVEAAAEAVGGKARIDPDNLAQVTCLTEWPHAVTCSFERAYLAVPQEALITTMETNQKYFPVLTADGRLTEHFIGIANIESSQPAEVRKGYERVIRPRFADAKFFFDEDLKQGLHAMGEGLKQVTYHAKLGSVADKVERVAVLAAHIAPELGVDAALAQRAARLAKNDLQSRMVNEFPELQGIAGRYYAAHAGLPPAVADAIDEAWMPRFSGDAIARSKLGQALAIAERVDALAGGFVAGLKPSGNKDPFALRRSALGLARTIIEGGNQLSLPYQFALALIRIEAQQRSNGIEHFHQLVAQLHSELEDHDALGSFEISISETSKPIEGMYVHFKDELYDFVLDRLRGYYEEQGFSAAQFDAVAALRPASLTDLDARLRALADFSALPEAAALAAANKRIRNLLKKADAAVPEQVHPQLFAEPAEHALGEAVTQAIAATDAALAQRDYVAVLSRLAQLRPQVDAFFDQVMVNADDPVIRRNRLALLKRLSDRLGSVAAIEQLSA